MIMVPCPHLSLTHITHPSTCDHNGTSLSPHPPYTMTMTTRPPPRPHRILTHLPPHTTTTTTVPRPCLTLIHIAHPSTRNHNGALPLHHPHPLHHTHTYGICYSNIHTLRLSPTMSAHAYMHSKLRPAPPHLVPPHTTTTTVPHPCLAPTSSIPPHATATAPHPLTHIVHPSTHDHNGTSPSHHPYPLHLMHMYSPCMCSPSEPYPCSPWCPHTIFTWFHGTQMRISSRLFHTHDVLVVATVIIIYDHLKMVWRWSRMWKMCDRSILQCIQQHREVWENCSSITPDAADAEERS